ncbi:MAG: glutathione S-transferase family protein [Pseudomonadota bacterium]
MPLTLYGYRFSVYSRIARMALHALDLPYQMVEVDPFADPPDPMLARVTRFGRVPVLDHDGFTLCETAAITRYLASLNAVRALVPDDPKARARMDQVIAVIDAYGYWPMVRQVFSHGVFRLLLGAEADPKMIAAGLADARPVLAQLEEIAVEGQVLNGQYMTLADIHLAPMLDYFTAAPQGADAVTRHSALSRWWAQAQADPAYIATDPGLATLTAQA